MAPRWEHFAHQADVGIRGFGETKARAFEQIGCALTALVTDIALVEPDTRVDFKCDAPDDELLLVEWLNRLIYEMATRKMLFSRFSVTISYSTLKASAWGIELDVARHQPVIEIKAATYTALRVATQGGEWMAQAVVDV